MLTKSLPVGSTATAINSTIQNSQNVPELNIAVGSRSPIKIGAAVRAFQSRPDISIRYSHKKESDKYMPASAEKPIGLTTIIPIEAKSGVNEQPKGHDETERGAATRMTNMKEIYKNADIYIAAENGIFDLDEKQALAAKTKTIDKAYVLIHYMDPTTKKLIVMNGYSDSVNWPQDCVDEVRDNKEEYGFKDHVVPDVMVKKYEACAIPVDLTERRQARKIYLNTTDKDYLQYEVKGFDGELKTGKISWSTLGADFPKEVTNVKGDRLISTLLTQISKEHRLSEVVATRDDPHKDTGKKISRVDLICDALKKLGLVDIAADLLKKRALALKSSASAENAKPAAPRMQ